ncbi:MAG: alpha/beta fold hydrolase [Gammaproteobacteria bacterium]
MNPLWSQRPVRAAGERPTVIGLHAAAGSPEQWWPLAERLRLRYRVLAPELHGYAAGRASGAHPPLSLEAETARIEPLLDAFPGPVYLVGHDYGAAVALKLAHRRRERIAGLVLYEPTLFGLLLADPGSRSAALDIAVLRRVLGRYLEAGDWLRAARRYVDHRSGADAWQGLSTQERAAIARRMPALCAQLDAQCADPTPLAGYAGIDVPVWLLTGASPRAATERITRLLAGTFPRAVWRRIDSADRMGPISRPEAVHREIEGFLAQQQASWHRDPEPTAAFGRPIFGALCHARELAEAASL